MTYLKPPPNGKTASEPEADFESRWSPKFAVATASLFDESDVRTDPRGIVAPTDSIDQSSENDEETVRDDHAIAVILDPTLKVAICVAVVSN